MGSLVRGNYKGNGIWYPGKIAAVGPGPAAAEAPAQTDRAVTDHPEKTKMFAVGDQVCRPPGFSHGHVEDTRPSFFFPFFFFFFGGFLVAGRDV